MKIHVNVMELLIEQEIVKYLKTPEYKHLRSEIVALMTYALNRVPPLYASSVQGLKSQINRGKKDYRSHIENAVRWSFTAVNKAPRQQSPDLTREIYQRVLAETRTAVRQRELSPIDLPEMIDDMVPTQPDQANAAEAQDDSGDDSQALNISPSSPGLDSADLSNTELKNLDLDLSEGTASDQVTSESEAAIA